jgi:hypothetical protein
LADLGREVTRRTKGELYLPAGFFGEAVGNFFQGVVEIGRGGDRRHISIGGARRSPSTKRCRQRRR